MRHRRFSFVQEIVVILVLILTLSLGGGLFSLYRLENYNMEYLYQLTEELINTSVESLEKQLEDIQTILYNIVVSNEVQNAGSALLEAEQTGSSPSSERIAAYDAVTDCIQKNIVSVNPIVCATYYDMNDTDRTVAMTRYYRLDDVAAEYVIDQAVNGAGRIVFLDGDGLTGDDNILILAMEVREKKNLSMNHMGVVVLFVDMKMLGSELLQSHDGIYVLCGSGENHFYILNDDEGVLDGYEMSAPQESGYMIRQINGSTFFLVERKQAGQLFSYIVATPYSATFSEIRLTYLLYMLMLILLTVVALAAGILSARWVMRDIRRFVSYIQHIPANGLSTLPVYEEQVQDKDVFALQKAFNQMAEDVNTLIRDNYMNQILIRETQLQALQAQINPHFLYNTLNSVYWMVKSAGLADAADIISRLSTILQETINNDEYIITVEEEMNIVGNYLAIQKYRYEDRLDARFDIEEDCMNYVIPKFTIQPVAENAITYGVECMLAPCTVIIRIFNEGSCYICEVRNMGPEPPEHLMEQLRAGNLTTKGNGIGLLNIEQRVRNVYGEEYGITVFRDDIWTVVQIRMKPLLMDEYRGQKDDGR